MTRLTATVTRTDEDRAVRALLCWHYGDRYGLDAVLDEVMADPTGVPGILFSVIDLATRLGELTHPEDFAAWLQARLIPATESPDEN